MACSTMNDALADERAARRQHRQIQKMQRAAARKRDRAWHARLREAIRDTRAVHKSCRCELRASMSKRELQALGAGCTAGRYVCPRLDAVRRSLGL